MRSKNHFRVLLLVLAASISVLLFSYSHKNPSNEDMNCDSGKCSQPKAQTEFILWESFTRNFLSASR